MADEETETNIFGDGVENRGVDDDDEIEMRNLNPYDSSSRRGSEDTTYRSSHSKTYGETSFIEGIDEHTPLITKESKRDEAWDEIRRKFPKVSTSKFTATLDDIGRVFVKLIRSNAKPAPLFNKDGEVNKKLPETIIKALGTPSEDIIRANEEEITRRKNKIKELQASRETASENQREEIDANIEEQQNEISRLEAENEHIEERMSLRDRVKLIFKKYGLTVFAVVSAVGLVIGVVVSNLKKGLTSLGKGVGGELKTIGKKIGEILPGMIGAIASFVFKTAGEAVGFLVKHAWLLILAAVTIMIEKLKKRNKARNKVLKVIKMKFITVKSKQTTASVDLVPPLVLGDKQRISLVDIRIPEQYFEFTDDQAIGDENRFKKKLKIIKLSKHLGKYNARRLQQVLHGDSLKAELGLEISITDKAAYLTTQSKEIIVSSELTKNFNIPRESKPYSAVKISGDEKYFVYCDLVEENNSLLSRENNAARVMPSKLLAVAPKSESGVYPELLIPAEKRVINNITLRIENEKFEVPDFNDEPIIYGLKIS